MGTEGGPDRKSEEGKQKAPHPSLLAPPLDFKEEGGGYVAVASPYHRHTADASLMPNLTVKKQVREKVPEERSSTGKRDGRRKGKER